MPACSTHSTAYASLILYTQVSSSHHLDKLKVVQSKALRIVTGCHHKTTVSHFWAETGVLLLRAYQELYSQVQCESVLPSRYLFLVITPSVSRPHRVTLQASFYRVIRGLWAPCDDPKCLLLCPFWGHSQRGSYRLARHLLWAWMIEKTIRDHSAWQGAPISLSSSRPSQTDVAFSYRTTFSHSASATSLLSYRYSVSEPTAPSVSSTTLLILGLPTSSSCPMYKTSQDPLGYVDSITSGCSVPGEFLSICLSASTEGRFWLHPSSVVISYPLRTF